MAQGNQKLKAASNKKGSPHHKRHATKTAKKTKKGNAKVERNKDNLETTKAINRKNERVIAAKALNSGLSFSLTDIAQKGKVCITTYVCICM